MEIDGIFTIVVGVAALLSPIIVAIQTSKQTKKELIINSRFEWIKSTKKILDDYVKKLHEYSASEEVDLNLINEVIELKTKLELQFKPYEIRERNIEINDTTTDSDLLDDKGHFRNDSFAPTYFMGDGHKRVYRYLDNRVDPMGSFIKKARKKADKS